MSGGISFGGIVPVMAVVSRGADKIIQVMAVAAADIGSVAGTYLGPTGPTTDINLAVPIEGADGVTSVVSLGTATIAESTITTLSLSVRRVTVAVTGAVIGGNYAVFPSASLAAGFGIVDAICTTTNQITFGILTPVLTLGGYSIGVRIYKVL